MDRLTPGLDSMAWVPCSSNSSRMCRCRSVQLRSNWQDRIQWNFALTETAPQPRLYDVEIRDPGTDALLATLYSFSTGTVLQVGDTGWQTHTADVSAFAGSTVRLLFNESVPEFFTGPGQLEIDAVRLDSASAAPEPASFVVFSILFGAVKWVCCNQWWSSGRWS